MPVDKAELAKDLETPEYQNLVKETLEKKEFVIRTKADETAFLDRHKTDVIEKEIPAKIQEVHNQYDKDFKTIFGDEYKRNQDEKTYDAFKRVAGTKLKTLGDEITTLKEQIKGGDPTGAIKKQLEEAEQKYKTELASKETRIKELESTATNAEKKANLNAIYADVKLTFKKDLPPMWSRTEKAILDEAMQRSVVKDGKLFITNADGSILKDAAFNEVETKSWIAAECKEVIDGQKAKGGSGSDNKKGDPGVDPSKITVENFVLREDIKTKSQLMDYMAELGLKQGSDQYNKIYAKFSTNPQIKANV